jgi:hypothetical protein
LSTPFTHAINVDSTIARQGWGRPIELSWKKKPYPKRKKVIMPEEGDQNQRIVKKVVKGYGDLASIQRWGLAIFL